jgi:hypothetical protein
MGEAAGVGELSGDDVDANFSPAPIDVNVDGLKDFRAWLGRELDANLRPGAHGILNDHLMGVRFGWRNAGTHVAAARQRYADSLEASTANLVQYVNASEVLIDAILQVVTNYRASDLSATDSSKILTDILGGVFAGRNSPDVDRSSEDRREQHRMKPDVSP